jgi:hypothetical protein
MFFSISSAFGDLTDDELRAYEMPLDNVISAHYRRNILLSMSMAMAVRIGDVISLGGVSRATLAAIKKRLPAYNVASSYAKRRIELYPDGIIDGNFELDESGVIRTSLRDFHAIYANNSPNMFVEHAINDGDLFQFLFESFGKYADLPTHLVHFRPCHSGGGTVGDVLRARNEGDRMGVCVCDRDCAPYGANPVELLASLTTQPSLYTSLQKMNLVEVRGIPISRFNSRSRGRRRAISVLMYWMRTSRQIEPLLKHAPHLSTHFQISQI